MENKNWGIGAKLWFGLMILDQWIMFIEYATKPITRYNSAYQQVTVIYGIVGIVGTALYLWLAISKKKAPLVTIMVIGGINVLSALIQGNVSGALLAAISPVVTFLVARRQVGYKSL
jgi:hypothetical protein